MYIAWDTETTGLPRVRTPPTPKNLHNYDMCRIVSIAAVKFSSRGRELASFHRIIKPDGYVVSATEIHGITHDYAMEEGTPFNVVFKEFMEFIRPVKTLVAHNSRFDENVLMSETLRIGLEIPKVNFVCTNEMHKEKLFRPIKLIDLYTTMFGRGFDGAHDALNDARACGEVYPVLRDYELTQRDVCVPKIIIKASDVSSIMGLSQFKKPQDVVEELWRKYLPDTCTMKTKDERALDVIEATPALQVVRAKIESCTTEVQTERMSLLDEVEAAPITPAEKGLVKDHFRKSLYTSHGVRHEERAAKAYAPGLVEDDTFYKYDVCTIKGTLYQIVGRVDRVRINDDGSRTLVELKNRTRGLFNRLRDYEEVQCRVYMGMMKPCVRDALLVESYDGEMKSYLVQRDDAKWDAITRKVEHFCSYFHHVISHKD